VGQASSKILGSSSLLSSYLNLTSQPSPELQPFPFPFSFPFPIPYPSQTLSLTIPYPSPYPPLWLQRGAHEGHALQHQPQPAAELLQQPAVQGARGQGGAVWGDQVEGERLRVGVRCVRCACVSVSSVYARVLHLHAEACMYGAPGSYAPLLLCWCSRARSAVGVATLAWVPAGEGARITQLLGCHGGVSAQMNLPIPDSRPSPTVCSAGLA